MGESTDSTSQTNGTNKDKTVHRELSYRVTQAVFEVHSVLGPGFGESVYEEALAHELGLRGIPFERQRAVTIAYKGQTVGSQRLDMVIEGKIVLELKAASELNDLFKQQTLSYLRATGLELGILINFGAARVEYVRITN